MALDLTNVKNLVNNVKRNLFFEDSAATLKFLNVSTLLLELTDGWYLDKNPERDVASPEFYLLSIVGQDINFDKVLPLTTSIKIGNVEFASFQYTRPRDATKEWLLKVQTAQMMQRDV